jgi:hypothetical protein
MIIRVDKEPSLTFYLTERLLLPMLRGWVFRSFWFSASFSFLGNDE